jgi:hypothetical protein
MRTRLPAAALAVLCLAPPAWADQDRSPGTKAEAKTYQVPYRLTNFNHVMVRAKINGKGPFNFIVDTGAPALFIAIPAAEQAGVKAGKGGWGTVDRFEIEGGVVLEKPRARIETPFQLEGMNGMGLAGVELHGMIGYTVLAKYRIDFDFTRSKLAWTPVDLDPGTPRGLEGGGGTAGLNAMGGIMKLIGTFLGKKATPEVRLRPFLGAELAEYGKGVTVKAVLAGGPAAAGGLRPGDHITEFSDRSVRERDDINRYLGHLKPGDTAKITVERDGASRELTVKVGEGF